MEAVTFLFGGRKEPSQLLVVVELHAEVLAFLLSDSGFWMWPKSLSKNASTSAGNSTTTSSCEASLQPPNKNVTASMTR